MTRPRDCSRELGLFSMKQIVGRVIAVRHREDMGDRKVATPARVRIEETMSSGSTMSLTAIGVTFGPDI